MKKQGTSIIAVLAAMAVLCSALVVAAADTTKTAAAPATGEQINWQVISTGGVGGTSTNYRLTGTVGQTAVSIGGSTNFGLNHGFWQSFGPAGCCLGGRGNVDGDPGDQVNITDLTYLVDFLFQGGPTPSCTEESDVNGDSNINVADLTYLVDFLFQGGPPPLAC